MRNEYTWSFWLFSQKLPYFSVSDAGSVRVVVVLRKRIVESPTNQQRLRVDNTRWRKTLIRTLIRFTVNLFARRYTRSQFALPSNKHSYGNTLAERPLILLRGNLLPPPRFRRDYPPNLSISVSGGKESNSDSLSSGERNGNSPAHNLPGYQACGEMLR